MSRTRTVDRGLVGTWKSRDQFGSTVQHRISILKGEFRVQCIDTDDGERAEVCDVKWDGRRLCYSLHWKSTGRITKNVMLRQMDNQVELTYAHTDREIMVRKSLSSRVKREARTS